jgi:hypothetical protein
MARQVSGRKVSKSNEARRALRNAITRANAKDTPEEREVTLRRGIATAQKWLDGTHEKLAAS